MPAPSQYVDHLETAAAALRAKEDAERDSVITAEEWRLVTSFLEPLLEQAARLLQIKRLRDHIDDTGTVNKNMLSDLRAFERQFGSLEMRLVLVQIDVGGQETTGNCSQQSPVDLVPNPMGVGLSA